MSDQPQNPRSAKNQSPARNRESAKPRFGPATDRRKVGQRRRVLFWTLGVIVLLLLFVIVSQQLWLWNIVPLDSASDTVVLYAISTLNFIAFVVFSFIFVRNLLKLRRERRERELGSKIKTRLLVYFIGISFLPIIAMAVFSYLFLNRSLEKWFSKLPEDVVTEALEVQREAVDAQYRSLRETALLLGVVLSKQPEAERQDTLNQMVARGQLSAVELLDAEGKLVAQSKANLPANESAELETLLYRARRAKGDADASLVDGVGFDLVSVPISADQTLILATARRANSDLNNTITGSQSEYQKLVARQRKVRWLGISTLGLMTLMLLFVSSWVAIYLAHGIATPIKSLAEASNEIARGNLAHRVIPGADDELALLAHSFNQMTAQLEENRRRIDAGSAELRDKNLALEERRNYIEIVLESLTTGVVSLDEADRVTTINAAAARMLRLSDVQVEKAVGSMNLEQLIGADDRVVLDRLLRRARRAGHSTEQTQLTGAGPVEAGPLPVALTATALRGADGSGGGASDSGHGVVLVIEDLSQLLAAQRAAAWSEVARRMAHEIKNPLTPIQLSAERIARSYHRNGVSEKQNGENQNGANANRANLAADSMRGAPPDDSRIAAVIDECTETITREVAGLKAMVDEFSSFARLPLAQLEPADLNQVVLNAVALYEDRLNGVELRTQLDPEVPLAALDSEQLRRVFVNLIDNALAAMTEIVGERNITIATKYNGARGVLIAEVVDTGNGIRAGDFNRLFQPYFSTRGGGTGLGLAIVQRIILEHHGRIRAEANTPRGARFVIELPESGRQ